MINPSDDKHFLPLVAAKVAVESVMNSPDTHLHKVRYVKLLRDTYAEAYRNGCESAAKRVADLEHQLRCEAQADEGLRSSNEELRSDNADLRETLNRVHGENAQLTGALRDSNKRIALVEMQLISEVSRIVESKNSAENMRKANEALSIRVVAANERSESLSRSLEESESALDKVRHDNARLTAMNEALEDELLITKARIDECRHIIRLMLES